MTDRANDRLLADIGNLSAKSTVETIATDGLRLLAAMERCGLRPGSVIPSSAQSSETLEQAQSHRDVWRTAGIAAAARIEYLEERVAILEAAYDLRAEDVETLLKNVERRDDHATLEPTAKVTVN